MELDLGEFSNLCGNTFYRDRIFYLVAAKEDQIGHSKKAFLHRGAFPMVSPDSVLEPKVLDMRIIFF